MGKIKWKCVADRKENQGLEARDTPTFRCWENEMESAKDI